MEEVERMEKSSSNINNIKTFYVCLPLSANSVILEQSATVSTSVVSDNQFSAGGKKHFPVAKTCLINLALSMEYSLNTIFQVHLK